MIEFCPHSLVSFKTESAKVSEWRLAELHVGDESRECRVQVTVNEVQGMADPCFLTSFDTIKPRGTYQAALGEFSLEVESSVSEKLTVIVWPER